MENLAAGVCWEGGFQGWNVDVKWLVILGFVMSDVKDCFDERDEKQVKMCIIYYLQVFEDNVPCRVGFKSHYGASFLVSSPFPELLHLFEQTKQAEV